MSLKPQTKVRYKSSPSRVGFLAALDGDKARVFVDGSLLLVPVEEIEPVPSRVSMSPVEFRVALTRKRLEHPLTEQLLSYRASKTRLLYYQYLPVKKIVESSAQRLLIADEVGLGKTIEAGLVWAELEARAAHGLESVWIICPKALVGKWYEEMLQRFDLRLEVLTSEGLRQALATLERDGVLSPRFTRAVVNLELIRVEEHVTAFQRTGIAWDLAIFDEAHHLRNPETLSHAFAQFVSERSKAVLFLTATPFQTGLDDIVHLMESLGVDIAADPSLLIDQIQWDMQLNDMVRLLRNRPPDWEREVRQRLAVLERDGGTLRPGWGEFKELVETSDATDAKQRALVIQAAKDIQILSPYMTRTLRSEVDVERPIREAVTRTIEFTPAEERFYQAVYSICLQRARAAGVPPGFATQMPERRVASSVPAVAREILRVAHELEGQEQAARFSPEEVSTLVPLARQTLVGNDSKYAALEQMLHHFFQELKVDRAMVFSTFRGTLAYLAERLRASGFSLDLVHGDVPARDEDCRRGQRSRERIARDFRHGKFQVLLASEVAGEGLDFEHCNVVINYDLPWNPMKVEQRIGRCDRLGQKAQKVYAGNLACSGTVEERILRRLYHRLSVFERALGDMELILGDEIAQFERDIFTLDLTAEQQEERLERIAQVAATLESQRKAIEEEGEVLLSGRSLIGSDQDEIKEAEARFLSPLDIAEMVSFSIDTTFPNCLRRISDEGLFEFVFAKEVREKLQSLLRAYPATHVARTEIARFSHRLEQAGKLRISFWGEHDSAEFVHIRHPVVLLARHAFKGLVAETPYCCGTISCEQIRSPILVGWAIGTLEGYASRADLYCTAVGLQTCLQEQLAPEIAQAWIRQLSDRNEGSELLEDGLDEQMAAAERDLSTQFDHLGARFKVRNRVLSERARQAIQSHAQRKLLWLQRQLSRNDIGDNIRNLYRGWSQRILAETQAKLDEIDQRSSVRSSLQIIGAALIMPMNENPDVT